MKYQISVSDMMCAHCAKRIENALGEINIKPEIDVESKKVFCETEKSADEVINAILDIGFDAKLI